MKPIHTIDDVISILQDIINESIKNQSPLGYFAALYQKVTLKVKEGIDSNYFDNGPRMEKLDIIFAKRYIDAYYSYQKKEKISDSWLEAFQISTEYWPIVLQHLLIGMNAHINLDLGIAAATVSRGEDIQNLKNDFNKINTILSSLVNEVEQDLSKIWPFLKKLLKYTKKVDDFLVDFSMEIARDGAWEFAEKLANAKEEMLTQLIKQRDTDIAKKSKIITEPGFIGQTIFMIVRLGEKGTVKQKITDLSN